jgi:hypothetical protein
MDLLVARTALNEWGLEDGKANILVESGHRNAAQVVEQMGHLTKKPTFEMCRPKKIAAGFGFPREMTVSD